MKNKKDLNIQVGEKIKMIRESRSLTQERFSELLDVTPQYISDLERGLVGISVPTLKHLCEVFSVSSDQIILQSSSSADIQSIEEKLTYLSEEQLAILNTIIDKFIEIIAVTRTEKKE